MLALGLSKNACARLIRESVVVNQCGLLYGVSANNYMHISVLHIIGGRWQMKNEKPFIAFRYTFHVTR